ncbi:MAG: hypothetical protein LBI87_01680 [Candidatus Accumulibacter sp.]|jgi:hypothetical protein|nr:hypothetical protein [Accumulibacter sp.]
MIFTGMSFPEIEMCGAILTGDKGESLLDRAAQNERSGKHWPRRARREALKVNHGGRDEKRNANLAMLAEAGIQNSGRKNQTPVIPAFAGMTRKGNGRYLNRNRFNLPE